VEPEAPVAGALIAPAPSITSRFDWTLLAEAQNPIAS
jgi:hypothetical protein